MSAVWEAQLLRVTFFPVHPVSLTSDWWSEFTGSDPESVTSLPKEQVTQVAGPFDDAHLSIISAPGRIDVLLQPPQPVSITAGAVSIAVPQHTLKDALALLSIVSSKISALAERMPLVQRLALGGIFLKEATSIEDSYLELKKLLKSVTVQPEKMRELIYRVNWPVSIDSKGFNRLGIWASLRVKVRAMGAGVGDEIPLIDKSYVSFEFDINTAPGPLIQFEPSDVRATFPKLAALLKENLEQGEVPSP